MQYSAPKTMGGNAGEPSIGVVWSPGATLQHDTVNVGGVIIFLVTLVRWIRETRRSMAELPLDHQQQ